MSGTATAPGVRYEPVIGLEVHAQLATRTKLFCGCSTTFGNPANTSICPVCIGLPGALPVINRAALQAGVKLALAASCRVQDVSYFARKNYFYPDLPKGYQISQFDRPYATGGHVEIEVGGETRRIALTRIHFEEDAGKSLHDGFPDSDSHTYLDFNRAGTPLCEIVSEPDIRTAEEASAYLVRLRSILTYLGVCDGNMEEGSMRCDANVSIRPVGQEALGTRTELKNLNSFRNVQRAIDYEIARQEEVLRGGGTIVQETRLFDADRGVTESMRSKEESHDYRYFPEPDLQPLLIGRDLVESAAADLPELPAARRRRFIEDLGLPESAADFLTLERPLADYFEAVAAESGDARAAANWVAGDLTRVLNQGKLEIADSPVSAADLGKLLRMIGEGKVSGKMAKEVFQAMVEGEGDAEAIVAARGLSVISDTSELSAIIARVLAGSEAQVAQYRSGKEKVFGYFVGQVMQATRGQANPEVVGRLLREALAADS